MKVKIGTTIGTTIGELANEICKLRKEVKAGKRDRKLHQDALSEGRFMLALITKKCNYDKDNGRKPKIRMFECLEL